MCKAIEHLKMWWNRKMHSFKYLRVWKPTKFRWQIYLANIILSACKKKKLISVYVHTINHRRFACTKVRRPLFFRPAYPAFISFTHWADSEIRWKVQRAPPPLLWWKQSMRVYKTAIWSGSLFFTVNLLLRWMLETGGENQNEHQ